MPKSSELLRSLLKLDAEEREAEIRQLSPSERREIEFFWRLWARSSQLPPAGDWRTWLICAGRGFGKTRAGSEWVRLIARRNPDARIALVGASLAEARAVMVEGESGILACSPPYNAPVYEPSLKRLSWGNGAQAYLYSAAEPESLRGPQHHAAWCDEIAKWDNASQRATRCWDNLLLGMRLGEQPRICATTTPRPVPLVKTLFDAAATGTEVVVAGGTSEDNRENLPEQYLADMRARYGQTALGRQELDGVMLDDIEGALWNRSLLEKCRRADPGSPAPDADDWARIVIGVDPPASATGDACGIIVVAQDQAGQGAVLADCSVEKAGPERWARAVATAAQSWQADRIIAEANQGGAMVGSVLRAAQINLPVKLVHASRGKVARAEPVAALYEAGRVTHRGLFGALEDEMCGLMAGGTYTGPGRSPDRADALVWAMTELMLGTAARPRVSVLS